MKIIKEHGKNLYSINLWIDCLGNYCNYPLTLQRLHLNFVLECISAGCPELKSLTLGSIMWNLQLNRENLEELHNSCKELKDLKLSNISFKRHINWEWHHGTFSQLRCRGQWMWIWNYGWSWLGLRLDWWNYGWRWLGLRLDCRWFSWFWRIVSTKLTNYTLWE